jgi:hypothetical protein
MAKGLKKIAQIAQENQAKREAFEAGGDFLRALVLKPGQTALGRFCEEGDDVTFAYTHDLPKKPGQPIANKILCLDQDDTGASCWCCEQAASGIKRGTRLVMNFIRYDEPKLKRGADGKAIKDNFGNIHYQMVQDQTTGQMVVVTEMALVVFTTGSGAGGRLAYLESLKGGIMRHVCKIARTTDNTNPFMIDIIEENKVPPTAEEVALFNKKTEPLKAITQLGKRSIPVVSYNDMPRLYGGAPAGGFAQLGDSQPMQDNIYAQAAQRASGQGELNLGAFGS